MGKIKFSPEINFGQLVQFIGFLGAGVMAWVTLVSRVENLEKADVRFDLEMKSNKIEAKQRDIQIEQLARNHEVLTTILNERTTRKP